MGFPSYFVQERRNLTCQDLNIKPSCMMRYHHSTAGYNELFKCVNIQPCDGAADCAFNIILNRSSACSLWEIQEAQSLISPIHTRDCNATHMTFLTHFFSGTDVIPVAPPHLRARLYLHMYPKFNNRWHDSRRVSVDWVIDWFAPDNVDWFVFDLFKVYGKYVQVLTALGIKQMWQFKSWISCNQNEQSN